MEAERWKRRPHCPEIIKNAIDVEIDEKDQVEEAVETKQTAEYTLTINTCVPTLKNKIHNKFDKV